MSTKKFSELTQVDAVAAGDKVPILDISTASTLYATFTQIAAFLANLTQTLSNKVIDGASNTLTARIASDVSGLASGIATFLGTPSGANLASALTSALPDTKGGTGLTALGTGVATFLGTPSGANLGSALSSSLSGAKVDTTLIGSQNIVTTGSASFGTTPATAGTLMLPNATDIQFRNAANSANVGALGLDSSNSVVLGGSATHGSQAVQTVVESSSFVIGRIGASSKTTLSSSSLLCSVAIVGNATAYGSLNGVGTQAMADANQTAAAAVYNFACITTTGAITADRNLTLPTGTDAQGYAKWINNTCTGAFNVVVKCASGTTVSIANGKSAWVWVDSRGVTRMTADV